MSGGGSAEAINKTARDDSGDEGEGAAAGSGSGTKPAEKNWDPE